MGGSSSSSSTTQSPTDPEAARRMAAVAERQQEMGEEQWSLAKETYLPYERAMVESNLRLLGSNEDLMRARLDEGTRDIEAGRELKDESRAARLAELKASTPAMQKYYAESTADIDEKAIDPGSKMRAAGAEAAQQFDVAQSELGRTVSRMGGNVGDLSTVNALRKAAVSRASMVAGARTAGLRAGETEAREQGRYLRSEKFARLSDAIAKRNSGMASQSTVDNTAYAQGELQVGNYNMANPADRSAGLYNNAINALAAGMRPLTQSESDSLSLKF